VYRNGDEHFHGVMVTVNRRQVPQWDVLLDMLTTQIKSDEAVRALCTPVNGTRLSSLDELEENYSYVALGAGRFKKIK
jgi:hypothetical protein